MKRIILKINIYLVHNCATKHKKQSQFSNAEILQSSPIMNPNQAQQVVQSTAMLQKQ